MGNTNGNGTDYRAVDLPDPSVEPRDTWDYRYRRAELLEMVLRRGGPHRLPSQQRLADTYGCHQSSISRDLDALADYIDLGRNIEFTIESAFHSIYNELMDQGEYREAWRVVEGYEKLSERRGAIPREPHAIDVRHGDMPPTETESYELVTEDNPASDDEVVVTADDLRPEMPSEGRPGGEGDDD